MSLIRAVEKFDFSRGNKFSTYASWAIMKNFARTIPEENYRRDRFVTGHEEMFEAAADNRTDEHEYESALKRMQEAVKGMLGPARRAGAQDHHQPLRPGRRERANPRTARTRAGNHQGTRAADRVSRPGKAAQDRQRRTARLADAVSRRRLLRLQRCNSPGRPRGSSAVMARGTTGAAPVSFLPGAATEFAKCRRLPGVLPGCNFKARESRVM